MAQRPEFLPRIAGPIVLRRLAPSDLAAFQAYRGDPLLAQYQGWSATTDAAALSFLQTMHAASLLQPGAWCQVGIALRDDPELIGDIGLLLAEDGRRAEIGFTLRRAAHGRGLAAAAVRAAMGLVFEQTGALRVEGITDARNLPSIRLLERVGMRWTGTHDTVFKGEPCTEYTYAIARADA